MGSLSDVNQYWDRTEASVAEEQIQHDSMAILREVLSAAALSADNYIEQKFLRDATWTAYKSKSFWTAVT